MLVLSGELSVMRSLRLTAPVLELLKYVRFLSLFHKIQTEMLCRSMMYLCIFFVLIISILVYIIHVHVNNHYNFLSLQWTLSLKL